MEVVVVFALVITAVIQSGIASGSDVILQPGKQAGEQVALIIIQGVQISPDSYVPFAKEVQNASEYAVWVGIPDFTFDVPEPIEISSGISRVLDNMKQAGMETNKIFFSGHSLGGVMIQDYVNSNKNATGLILMSSYLLRKYRNVTYPVPALTISGTLDGLTRVTRIMEEYYFRIENPLTTSSGTKNFPVVVVKGMNHFQFASGDPPIFVKYRDLRSEMAESDAHRAAAAIVVAFMAVQIRGDATSLSIITSAVKDSGTFLAPIIRAYELEGFYQFKPPCYNNPPSSSCQLGCPWTERAQPMMGDLKTAQLIDTDGFHPVYQVNPVHLPHIINNCSAPSKACVLHTTTVSQNEYSEVDKLDTGFVYTSASEIRAKLKSRQAIMEAAGYKNVSFNETDGGSICQTINQQSLDWSFSNADSTTQSRYIEHGEYMVVGRDKGPYNEGPLWIWTPMSYKTTQNSTGGDQLEVRSVMMRTPNEYWVKAAAGMHYCKLLSPARSTEWIYVDSLRKYYGIQSKTQVA